MVQNLTTLNDFVFDPSVMNLTNLTLANNDVLNSLRHWTRR